jgi:tetratricopeptide (TPR) repeat protein
MDHYLESLAIKERVGDIYGQGVLAVNIGEIHRIRGQSDQAIAFYQRSLQVWDELGVTYGKGLIHNNLGAVLLRMGDLEQATEHLDQSEELFAQIPSDDFVAETSRYRAQVALRQGQINEALTFADRSLQHALDQGLKADECAVRRVLGEIYCEKNDPERCEEYLSQSLDLAHELDNRYELGRTTLRMGVLYRKQGRFDEAKVCLLQARGIFEELDASLDLAEIRKELETVK